MLKWVWLSMKQNRLVFIEIETLPPRMHRNWKEIACLCFSSFQATIRFARILSDYSLSSYHCRCLQWDRCNISFKQTGTIACSKRNDVVCKTTIGNHRIPTPEEKLRESKENSIVVIKCFYHKGQSSIRSLKFSKLISRWMVTAAPMTHY